MKYVLYILGNIGKYYEQRLWYSKKIQRCKKFDLDLMSRIVIKFQKEILVFLNTHKEVYRLLTLHFLSLCSLSCQTGCIIQQSFQG